ncbi:MAG: acyl carrier protein [Geitlerinemataceae cyanobacterium]
MQLLNQSGNGEESYPFEGEINNGESSAIPSESYQAYAVLLHWLISRLAEQLELDVQQIDVQKEFTDYGLNSIEAVSLSGDLENFLKRRLPPTLLWDYPTIETLARYLTAETSSVEFEKIDRWATIPSQKDSVDSAEAQQILENVEGLSDTEIDALLGRLLSEKEN